MRIAFFLWMSGSRPPVQWIKKSFRLRLIRVPQVTDVPNVPSVLPKIKKHLTGWIIQTVPQAHFWDL